MRYWGFWLLVIYLVGMLVMVTWAATTLPALPPQGCYNGPGPGECR